MNWYQFWREAEKQLQVEKDPVIIRMIEHRMGMFKYLMGESK